MGEAYRGLTIRFKADGRNVISTLESMRRAGRDVSSELRMIQKALKLDGSNQKASQRQLMLLGEKASASAAEVKKLEREMRDLGKVTSVGGNDLGGTMEKVAAKTRDASMQASLLKERYNEGTAALGRIYTELNKSWMESKKFSKQNPFKHYKSHELKKVTGYLGQMVSKGIITLRQAQDYRAQIVALKTEFKAAAAEKEKMDAIAAYQSGNDKLLLMTEEYKAAARELAIAARQATVTRFDEPLREARTEAERLKTATRGLRDIMRADPSNWAAFEGYFRSTRTQVRALEGEVSLLEKQISELGRGDVRKAAADMERLSEKARTASSRVEILGDSFAKANAEVDLAQEKVDDFKRKIAAATKAHGRQSTEVRELNAQLNDASKELDEARVKAKMFESALGQATARSRTLADALKLNEARSALVSRKAEINALNKALERTKKVSRVSSSSLTGIGMTMYSTVFPMAMMAGTYAVQAAKDVDGAYRDMRKTVQGTESDFENLKQKALDFSDTHYTSADNILQIEAIGGMLGITVDNLEAFSKTIANLNIATNVDDAEELATQFGKMASVMGLTNDEYDRFADALVRLGNSEPAMESDILNMTTRFMGMGRVVGMTSDQMLAWATAAVAAGQKPEAAGSSMLRMVGRFEAAVSGVSDEMRNLDEMTEEDIEAFEAAKEKLEGYASVAGMSSEQFAKLWDTSPSEALQSFVEGLHRMDVNGESAVSTLKELGINNVRDQQLFLGLASTTDVLNDSLTMSKHAWDGVSDQWGDAGDAAREAEKKSQGFSGQLQIMANNGQHLAEMMGESLAPVLQLITGVVQNAVDWFESLDETSRLVVTSLIGVAVASGPVLTALGAFKGGFDRLRESSEKYRSAEQMTLRMERSRVASVTGLRGRYSALRQELEKTRRSMDFMVSANSKVQGAYGKQIDATEKKIQGMERSLRRMSKLQKFGSVMSGIGMAAGIGAALTLVGMLVDAWADAAEKAEKHRKATEGLAELAKRAATGGFSKTLKDDGDAAGWASEQYRKLRERMEELDEKGAQLYDTIDKGFSDAETNGLLAKRYADTIGELAGKCQGSEEKMAELRDAVDQFNQLTGSDVQIVDNYSGAIDRQTESVNLLAQSYRDALYAQAAKEAGAETAKLIAEKTKEFNDASTTFQEAKEVVDNSIYKGVSLTDTHLNNMVQAGDEEATKYVEAMGVIQESSKVMRDSDAEIQQLEKDLDSYFNIEADHERRAEAVRQANEALTASVEDYRTALAEAGDENGLDRILESTGLEAEDLKAKLNDAGIGAQDLARIGADAFLDLYNSANGDMTNVRAALNLMNDFEIEPKDLEVDENGVLKAKGHVIDLDNMTIDGKKFNVTSDGSVEAEGKKVADLKARIDETTGTYSIGINADTGNAWDALTSLRKWIADNIEQTFTAFIRTDTSGVNTGILAGIPGRATGGFFGSAVRVPAYATGAVLNGIVTKPMLTNRGLVGEAGSEAVIPYGRGSAVLPVTNGRYVRPLARTIAHEMGGGQPTVNNYYSVGGVQFAEGSDGAEAVKALVRAVKRVRGA